MNRIVFSDVDGTLINSKLQVTSETLKAIKTLQQKDIPFVIISARSPSGIYPILKENDFTCPIISYSGALILDENRNILFHKGIKKEKAAEIINYLEKDFSYVSWCIYAIDDWIVKDKKNPHIISEENVVKAQSREGSILDVHGDQVSKILCICDPLKIDFLEKSLKEKYPDCTICKSDDYLLEIMEGNINKGTAVKTMCELWNVPLENAIAFGDNYNDEPMLKVVGKGFIMENGPEPLKQRIKLHTASNNDEGIYKALQMLGLIL